MKIDSSILAMVATVLISSPAVQAQTSAAAPITPFGDVVKNYTLSWSDEFDAPTLDPTKWTYRTDTKMWSTQLPANVSIADGKLVISVKKEKANGKNYTGGGIISTRAFEYGYYEARFKVPPGSGWHTSFWTMDYNAKDTAPKNAQEIDICEQDSNITTKYSAGVIAWGNHGKGIGRKYVQTPDLAADFHIWGCEFTPTIVNFYFDGKLTHQADATKFKQGQQNIWLTCISTPLGHTTYVDNNKLPSAAEFDYVRYFSPTEGSH